MEHIVLQKRVVASPFLKKFLRQSQPNRSERETKKDKSSPNME